MVKYARHSFTEIGEGVRTTLKTQNTSLAYGHAQFMCV